MSFFGSIFGSGKPKERAPTTHEAIQKLNETKELLEKKSDFIEKKILHEVQTAKKNASTNKRVALKALKNKKRLEKQQKQLDGTLTTLDFQIDALENANTNVEVLGSMKFASEALKQAQMNPDEVHDIMDDLAEQKEVSDEITEAMTQLGQYGTDVDEDELMNELEELENEGIEEDLLNVKPAGVAELPEVPDTELPKAKEKKKIAADDDDMRELEAWAS